MKQLLTGNEAIARGAWEAGVLFASAFPGTPSTEILETLTRYQEVDAEWAPNEKVAMEAALGASIAGARVMVPMKHVGANLSADPLSTLAFTGVKGGVVLVAVEEPEQRFPQTEQDNRYYAKIAKMPMLEPSDSQECRDMARLAFEISEEFDTPVLLRAPTRVCHSQSPVCCGERSGGELLPYDKGAASHDLQPASAKEMRMRIEKRSAQLAKYAETTPLNRTEWYDKRLGVIASGVCYAHAREAFGEAASYLKLGFTWPLPEKMIDAFCREVEALIVVEENDPYLEETVRLLGYGGKVRRGTTLPRCGELTPDTLRQQYIGEGQPAQSSINKGAGTSRPSALCPGCPHRGFYHEAGKRDDLIVAGDIGCNTRVFSGPHHVVDFNISRGASFSAGHGMQKALDRIPGNRKRVVATMGHSTFFLMGMSSLLEVACNRSRTICVILDNITAEMNGQRRSPGVGNNTGREAGASISAEVVVRALGINHVRTVNPNDLEEVAEALDWAMGLDGPAVIVSRWPCALKHLTLEEREEYGDPFLTISEVGEESCVGCKQCIQSGCPALGFDPEANKAEIDPMQCVGCGVCGQICPAGAIRMVVEEVLTE